ncbi:lytic murein transglycosylase [Streptomyces sp. NPDC013953]|uniref:lytic transglycosylase domain-containing protein n=1 Tax=Streptomyces sp. NPDC013953 TaxID=3364868 RepID=UPI003703510B
MAGKRGRTVRGTALVAAAMAALSASQAPGAVASAPAGPERGASAAGPGVTGGSPYRTELPPLRVRDGAPEGGGTAPAGHGMRGALPAAVLAAYRQAETELAGSAPGCGLRWELLAAIGQVESGHARGGRLTADGTTVRPILGPRLDGNGFALIRDTDGGAHDGDTVYDRAVGPMQFIPSTWAAWGADGNGDGRADPGNIHDAATAAGRYLCAGGRDLSDPYDLDRAILGYNHSAAYLRTVRAWYGYFLGGDPVVTAGPVPAGDTDAASGGGRDAGPGGAPARAASPHGTASARPSRPRDDEPAPAPPGTREPAEPTGPRATDGALPHPSESSLPVPDASVVLPRPPLGNGQDSMPAAPSTIPDTGR